LSLSFAYRTVDEPAEMACIEFPRGAGIPNLGRTAPNIPAATGLFADPSLEGLQKEALTLDVHRYFPPTLLETLHGLKRCPQELCHLLLGLLKFSTESLKLFAVHFHPSFGGRGKKICSGKNFHLTGYTTLCYLCKGFFRSARDPKNNFCSMSRFQGEVYSPPAVEDCFATSRNGRA